MRLRRNVLIGVALLAGLAHPAMAGMGAPGLIVTELGKRRLEELSFFLFGFLLMALVVKGLWNWLRRDLPSLPKLSYGRSVSLLVLWGLLMAVVLTMISGARELMTPAAWVPNGVTYQLASNEPPAASIIHEQDQQRQQRLENLRFALWHFATTHEGRFPAAGEVSSIPSDLWFVQAGQPLRYVYIPGLSLTETDRVIVYEPEIYEDQQYVIHASGAISKLSEDAQPPSPDAGPAATSRQ